MTKKPLVIAVDFDGTIVENDFPKIGAIKKLIVNKMKSWKEQGHKIIIWTCREKEYLQDAIKFLKENNIPFDKINENMEDWIEIFDNDSRKIGADIYIDDKAINPLDINNQEVLGRLMPIEVTE